jgi:hypothetical protein
MEGPVGGGVVYEAFGKSSPHPKPEGTPGGIKTRRRLIAPHYRDPDLCTNVSLGAGPPTGG